MYGNFYPFQNQDNSSLSQKNMVYSPDLFLFLLLNEDYIKQRKEAVTKQPSSRKWGQIRKQLKQFVLCSCE
jgi:hypothetical protein